MLSYHMASTNHPTPPSAATYPLTPVEKYILEHLYDPDLELQLVQKFHKRPAGGPYCGTIRGYNHHHCRCELCKEAGRSFRQGRR